MDQDGNPRDYEVDRDDDEDDDGDDVFEVEKIVQERKTQAGNTEYLIHWKGYSIEERTWEPIENIFDPDLIERFKKLNEKENTKKTHSRTSATQQQKKKDKPDYIKGEHQREKGEDGASEVVQESKRGRKRRIVSYKEDVDDDKFVPKKRSRTRITDFFSPFSASSSPSKPKKTNCTPKRKVIDLDSDEEVTFSNEESSSDEEMSFDEEEEDDDDEELVLTDDDDFIVFETTNKKKKKKPVRNTKGSKTTPKAKTVAKSAITNKSSKQKSKDGNFESPQEELEWRMQKELVRPNNNPQKLPAAGPYVDPVGVDPTHGIVEGIVAGQVGKVGELLRLVAESKDDDSNDNCLLTFPIRLQTACSGTDAPSIALGFIQESLDKLYRSNNENNENENENSNNKQQQQRHHHGFEYQHVMSCEIEPFKQAYIGRNFPGVPLFPDITKLTESEQVVDVYGRPRTIPKGNLFVAGTSCKDFSMLKTRNRQDIEDKGTSGETFLAAVEFLDQEQPPFAIFENVDGAPWIKMQEYITGRVELASRNNTKSIKAGKTPNADKDLKFSINSKGRYVVEEVPRQVGIRAGSIVQGFVKSGDDPGNVILLTASSKSKKGGLVTLGELAKQHSINLNRDVLVMEKQARYCTHLCKIDTKDYGLPQTRNRKYLFIWRSNDPDDDLGGYLEEILVHLKTPLLYSMDAFLLPPTHDRIRCFREALRSGPGLMVARERAKELDFWDWELSRNLDTPRHLNFRRVNGIAERSRWLTGWDTRGRKKVAPGLWPELVDMWNMRRCDMIDCFGAAAMRDATPRDALHHSFTWDLSQNVTRAPFRSATVGVCGCVTPGGELILPHKGRTLMGYEKLLLQGIPFSRLLLGPETEVQLSDLAGNAMSVSVICATMLSAICAPKLRQARANKGKLLITNFALSRKYDAANGAVLAERGDLYGDQGKPGAAKDFVEAFEGIAKDLAQDAFRSSALCTCESSGRTTNDPIILECQGCGFLVCHECSGRQQTESHKLKEVDVGGKNGRPDPNAFERKLRCAVPSVLRLGKGWEKALKDGGGLESYSFQLQQVDRKTKHWLLTYGAWEDYGSARQVAEIRVSIGQVGTFGKMGLAAYVRCFAPAIRHVQPKRGPLRESARLFITTNPGNETKPEWEIPIAKAELSVGSLEIVGNDSSPSQRVQIGLSDVAWKSLKAHKAQKQFIPNIKSRNNLLSYHRKWKTWPKAIDISGDKSNRVNGLYQRLNCEQTTVHSALWRRDGTRNMAKMFIYIRPDVIRTGLDVAVISPTPSHQDNLEIAELIDWIPENAWEESTFKTRVKFLDYKRAPPDLKMEIPTPKLRMTAPKSFQTKTEPERNDDAVGSILCEMDGLSREIIQSLLEYNGSVGKNGITEIDLVGRCGTRNAKRLSIVAAPSLLKYAAESKLPLDLSNWYSLPSSSNYGSCETNVPPRPQEQWKDVAGRKVNIERVYDAEESNEYYQRLLKRPTAFQVHVDGTHGKLIVRMNPHVAAHHAAASLVRGRAICGEYAKSLEIDFCLSELSSMGEPDTKEFHVPNSDLYEETTVCGLALPLYKRQAKALTRMQAIESGEVNFSEEERSEHVLPGIGWCLIARAAKKSPLRGGVLGDAIGSGKTVVTIALILAGVKRAQANRDVMMGVSGATLVVVPPGLVQQWDDERKKFTKNKLKCITIDCTATLKKCSVKDLCDADMVIVPANILEERPKSGKARPYTEHLSKMARAGKIPPAPTGYSQREAPTIEGTWVRNMASGPEIYVGNKGKQRSRDEQAYYGHCYSEAITQLRGKKFGPSDRGIPLEYFTWERIVIDECHETLVTGKSQEIDAADFKAQARRGAREFLGVAQTDITKRPLVATTGVWGLTGTPLLETEARVTELANLMGGTYLTGAAHHWRKEERESGRDLFLNQQEGTRSREYRCAVQAACHTYVKDACQRNRGSQLEVSLSRKQKCVNMSPMEADVFVNEIASIQLQGFGVNPDKLGEKTGKVLSITASSQARHGALFETIESISELEPHTKIIVFANAVYGGYKSALAALAASDREFCHVSENDTVYEQNKIISWFRHTDATEEDRQRPRILLLSFEQAAGHNLQEACHHVVIYDPMYSGADAVADASVEEQAVGRVMRQGQKYDVSVTRIIVKGPNGERCLDDWIVERNLDEDVLRAATSNFD